MGKHADDCSIFLKSKSAAERVLASISRFLEKKLHLEVNQEKTKIVRPVVEKGSPFHEPPDTWSVCPVV